MTSPHSSSEPSPLRIAVFGSTGSVGTRTLDVVAAYPDRFRVVALAGGQNMRLLSEQVSRFSPPYVSCDAPDPAAFQGTARLSMTEIGALPDIDAVVVGTAGTAALLPVISALEHGKIVALANKEILVMAGRAITKAAKRGGGSLRPVDSEHSAIWQCLWGEQPESIETLILTASGGAFRDMPLSALESVTPEQAVQHPIWSMGRKITVDSATLMNKGLETIEARWLFDVPMERVRVLMHRESIVHSLVEFTDGSVKAQLGEPDMRLPIMCALSYPARLPAPTSPRLRLGDLGALHFGEPDFARYPCLTLAMEAGRRVQTYPAVLVGAGDVAVEAFLCGRIGFNAMASVVEHVLGAHIPTSDETVEAVIAAESWARACATTWIASCA